MMYTRLFEMLEIFPWGLGVVILVAMYVAFTVIGILIARRFVNKTSLQSHHDVAAVVFANLGVLYSVLLGFTVVNVQQRFDKIKDIVQIEASSLADLYRDAEVFSKKDRDALREKIIDYIQSVISDEWPSMAKGEVSILTSAALTRLWNTYYTIFPADEQQKVWYSESISKLNQLMSTRLSRLLGSQESLGDEMWTLLFLGSFVMVAFVWFFGFDSLVLQLMMGGVFAASIAFLLFLIYSLDTAFTGDVNVSPLAMQDVLKPMLVGD